MISARNLLLGIVLGAVVALIVQLIGQYGLALGQWTVRGPRVGEALITGALIGAVSQLVGQTRGRR
ncbi:hypothetical protein [Sphingomonas endolithica]|uniref:hypothetical protein n=1 Tax=Sphingomonas endolithica TaxID=2972485 RepID=UPI0021AF6A2F|nr:hypothetical protein [Sphingomonas sp. ZFBP2030]